MTLPLETFFRKEEDQTGGWDEHATASDLCCSIPGGINLQNLQTGHTAQYHNSSNPKWAEDALKQTYL